MPAKNDFFTEWKKKNLHKLTQKWHLVNSQRSEFIILTFGQYHQTIFNAIVKYSSIF